MGISISNAGPKWPIKVNDGIQKRKTMGVHEMRRRQFALVTFSMILMPKALFASSNQLQVFRTETCGCCGKWVEAMNGQGLELKVQIVDDDTLWTIKNQLEIPLELSSCHTAIVENYFVEGHVPASDIQRLLNERPNARGLTVPGMPIGSPGMEMGTQKEPFETLLVLNDSNTIVFNQHN
tara:strand:- start:76 stop:615 length:540 start_codon:yes stop_codon:yes gene_type:complete